MLERELKNYRRSLAKTESELEDYRRQLLEYMEQVKKRHADEALRDAGELLAGDTGRERNWNYGNAVHNGNLILGRIALKAGDLSKAKGHLIAAGRTPGSPQLDSFGPDLELAQRLLDKGEGETVAEYLRLVSKFCKLQKPRLDGWATAIEHGGRPQLDFYVPSQPRGSDLLNGLIEVCAAGGSALAQVKAGLERSARQAEGLGKPFELTFTDAVSGREISLQKDLKGKVVVLDFWATWCPPCVRAVPGMKKLYAQYRGQGVEFVGVSLDSSEADGGLVALKDFVSKNGIAWPQYHQGAGDLGSRWAVGAIPTVFVIDADGKLASTDARGNIETLIPQLIAKRDRVPAACTTPALAGSSIDAVADLGRGVSLDHLRALLGQEPRHQFTSRLGASEYVCVSYAFRQPYTHFYFVFRKESCRRSRCRRRSPFGPCRIAVAGS